MIKYNPKKQKKLNKITSNLILFLSSHRFNYTEINDGWYVEVQVNSIQELFNSGKMFGNFLAELPYQTKYH